jgi:hypothetical protein
MDGSQIAGCIGLAALPILLAACWFLGGWLRRRVGHTPWFDDTEDETWHRYQKLKRNWQDQGRGG